MSPEFKKLIDIFTVGGEQLIFCENPDIFTMVMSIFTQYEKHVSTSVSIYCKILSKHYCVFVFRPPRLRAANVLRTLL